MANIKTKTTASDKISMPDYAGPWPLGELEGKVILDGISTGLPIELALRRARVSPAAYASFTDSALKGDAGALVFAQEIERAEAEFCYDALIRALTGVAGSKESMTVLSRRFREHFAIKPPEVRKEATRPIERLADDELEDLLD